MNPPLLVKASEHTGMHSYSHLLMHQDQHDPFSDFQKQLPLTYKEEKKFNSKNLGV